MREIRSTEVIKASIFNRLRAFGGDFAEADYSGGNDEGGVEDVTVYVTGENGERVPLKVNVVGTGHYKDSLWADFNELLTLDFGTWAGDLSAHGTVYADLAQDRVWRTGQISTYEDDAEAGDY
jgi:hypothetical protein